MLNISLTDRYNAAHDWLLEEDTYTEEVVVEASIEPFYLTCSIGNDSKGQYLTWNLRYYNAFIEHLTIRSHKCLFKTSDHHALLRETEYKFRQLLLKAANTDKSIADIAFGQLAKL